ncbi:glycoside hydrolase [Stachybotrys elegans]|uniref:lytic cellulose monooxygenase (C4-dehydrogenating) n=1 Tax=Stachybotrys elegans TaxID=80388 RepID=A0A8K0WV16_9HYPO|nr:glycoside hydrolase [Stachybotrys elegans]
MVSFKSLAVSAVTSMLAIQTANAHYVYSILIHNGEQTPDWQYIRQNSNNIQPHKQFLNPTDDFRCNAGSFQNAGRTQVRTVSPGDTLGFKLWNNGQILHPGPMTIHMSRAPGNVQQYQGEGEWFKVYEDIICGPMNPLRDTDWCSWDQASVSFQVPASTPPGQYLVRVEHIAIHGAESGDTEFYFTCAQIEVTGNGSGNPGPLVRIPGLYDSNDPALRFFIYGAQSYPFTQIGAHSVWRG